MSRGKMIKQLAEELVEIKLCQYKYSNIEEIANYFGVPTKIIEKYFRKGRVLI